MRQLKLSSQGLDTMHKLTFQESDPMSSMIHYSKNAKHLLKDLLNPTEEDRPTASQLLDKYSDWFSDCKF